MIGGAPRHRARRLDADDARAFQALRLEGLDRHPEAFGASLEIERAQPLAFFEARLLENVVFGGFGAACDLDGVVGLRVAASPKTRHIATLWGMYVRERARRMGLARGLVQAELDAVPEDCRSVSLSVVSTSKPSASVGGSTTKS